MKRVQTSFNTGIFRQTEHLQAARHRLSATSRDRPLRILSFGCSIGDEIVTLRYMFPDAEIFGCDIEDRLLEVCNRTVGSFSTVFRSSRENIQSHGPFDLVLVSAVLCLNPPPEDATTRFPPSRFDDILSMLDESIAYGGLLVLINAAYRFVESPVAANYDTIRCDIVGSAGFVDVFSRRPDPYLRQAKSPGGPLPGGKVYERLGDFVPRDDEDLADSIFEKRRPGTIPAIHEFRLQPPPERLQLISSHKRTNVDWLPRPASGRIIVIESEFQFCLDLDSGQHGYLQSLSWTSLVGEGMHRRNPAWHWTP